MKAYKYEKGSYKRGPQIFQNLETISEFQAPGGWNVVRSTLKIQKY